MKSLEESLSCAQLQDHIKLIGIGATGNSSTSTNGSTSSNITEANLLGMEMKDLATKPISGHDKDFVLRKLEESLFDDCLKVLKVVSNAIIFV